MKSASIDFGTFTRPNGTVGRLVLEVAPNGRISLNHMVTPHEGTILATGHFADHISPEFADLAVEQIRNAVKRPHGGPLHPEVVSLSSQDWWSEHSRYDHGDWFIEVSNGDTLRGYWEWVSARLWDEEDEAESTK